MTYVSSINSHFQRLHKAHDGFPLVRTKDHESIVSRTAHHGGIRLRPKILGNLK